MNKYNQPRHIGNDWGHFVDIEKYKYDINTIPMPLIKTPIYNYGDNNCNINCNIDINNRHDDDINNKVVANIIIKVSSTTIVTAVFACFVYCIL
jgi:hypothetical protein